MKCKNPIKHKPQFEGKHHCKHCEREAFLDLMEERKCGEKND
tara:strand:- start:326 stop:451 length:126 start_codon:yes stop_codon:yes gene_type:complete